MFFAQETKKSCELNSELFLIEGFLWSKSGDPSVGVELWNKDCAALLISIIKSPVSQTYWIWNPRSCPTTKKHSGCKIP